MRIAFRNSCLDVCFLNFWLLNTGLDFKTTKKNTFTIALHPSSATSPMWKICQLFLGTPWICESHIPSFPEYNLQSSRQQPKTLAGKPTSVATISLLFILTDYQRNCMWGLIPPHIFQMKANLQLRGTIQKKSRSAFDLSFCAAGDRDNHYTNECSAMVMIKTIDNKIIAGPLICFVFYIILR